MLHFKSYRLGEISIVLGYVRALAPLLTICLYWHEGEACVFVRDCATIATTFARSSRTCALSRSQSTCGHHMS